MRRLLFALPLLGFAAVAGWFLIGLGRDPATIPSALIGKPVPDFALPPLAGADRPALGAADLRGRVALVNFYASWCAPCRVEHPLLMQLAAKGEVPVLGVSYKDEAAASLRFLQQLGNPYAAIGYDREGRVAIDWGVYGVPETFLLDAAGIVRWRFAGAITPEILAQDIRPLLRRHAA